MALAYARPSNSVSDVCVEFIGYYPDNGGSHFLSHLSGELGTYLGLTGHRLKGFEAYKCGLATHYITSSDDHVSMIYLIIFIHTLSML